MNETHLPAKCKLVSPVTGLPQASRAGNRSRDLKATLTVRVKCLVATETREARFMELGKGRHSTCKVQINLDTIG